jgi:hypothetical protein
MLVESSSEPRECKSVDGAALNPPESVSEKLTGESSPLPGGAVHL